MVKKYVVRLTDEERDQLTQIVRKLKGTSQKVRRAQFLLKADTDGPAWTDAQIADAFDCRTRTLEKLRQRVVDNGLQEALNGKKPAGPPVPLKITGEQEAKIIALRLGPPPKGFAKWSLRLLADQVVELGFVGAISHETVRQRLKKMA